MKAIRDVSSSHPFSIAQIKNALPVHLLEKLIHHNCRFRTFDPVTTVFLFAQQVLGRLSCREVLGLFNLKRFELGEKTISLNTSSYCRAKSKLCENKLKDIATGVKFNSISHPLGRRVFHVDGTTLQAEDTAFNQAEYPQNPKQRPGLGQPLLRMVLIFCASTGKLCEYISCSYLGKGTAEPSLFRKIIGFFEPGDIVIGDRFYSGTGLCCEILNKKFDFIFRARDSFVKTRIGKKWDHVFYFKGKEYFTPIRLIKFKSIKKGFRDKYFYFMTSLPIENYPREVIGKTYLGRWQVEVNIRDFKRSLEGYFLKSKSPAMLRKEISIIAFAYNLTRRLISMSDSSCVFKKSFNLAKNLLGQLLGICSWKQAGGVVKMIKSYTLSSKFRSEVRAIKRRTKGSFPNLMVPRAEAKW